MELVAKGKYLAGDLELHPGDDTLDRPHLSDERKARILADFPDLVEEIEDVDQYLADKGAANAARAELAAVVPAAEPVTNNPFEKSPATMTASDRFEQAPAENAKDLSPERKDAGLVIETPEAKAPRGKRK
jgi:hypothetical protein